MRTKVRPLAQVGFAEDHRSRIAESLNDASIEWRSRSAKRQGACGCRHFVLGGNVVFDQHWNPVERTARSRGFPFLIQAAGNGQSVRIQFNHRAKRWSSAIDFFDTFRVFFDKVFRRKAPRLHASLEFPNSRFIQVKWPDTRSGIPCVWSLRPGEVF